MSKRVRSKKKQVTSVATIEKNTSRYRRTHAIMARIWDHWWKTRRFELLHQARARVVPGVMRHADLVFANTEYILALGFPYQIAPFAIAPPSTTSISPVTYALALLARNSAGPMKSSGAPHLPPGIPLRRLDTNAGSCLATVLLCHQLSRGIRYNKEVCAHVGSDTSRCNSVDADIVLAPFI